MHKSLQNFKDLKSFSNLSDETIHNVYSECRILILTNKSNMTQDLYLKVIFYNMQLSQIHVLQKISLIRDVETSKFICSTNLNKVLLSSSINSSLDYCVLYMFQNVLRDGKV